MARGPRGPRLVREAERGDQAMYAMVTVSPASESRSARWPPSNAIQALPPKAPSEKKGRSMSGPWDVERETRLELATPTLARNFRHLAPRRYPEKGSTETH